MNTETSMKNISLDHNSCTHMELRKVKFDKVTVHECNQTLGGNPDLSRDSPLTLGYESISTTKLDVDFYEYVRSPQRVSKMSLLDASGEREINLLLKAHKFNDFIDVKDKTATAQGEDKSLHAMKVLKTSKNQRQRKVFALPA